MHFGFLARFSYFYYTDCNITIRIIKGSRYFNSTIPAVLLPVTAKLQEWYCVKPGTKWDLSAAKIQNSGHKKSRLTQYCMRREHFIVKTKERVAYYSSCSFYPAAVLELSGVGSGVGTGVGSGVGTGVGSGVGTGVGSGVGGSGVGSTGGVSVGSPGVGDSSGDGDGTADGDGDGDGEGDATGAPFFV